MYGTHKFLVIALLLTTICNQLPATPPPLTSSTPASTKPTISPLFKTFEFFKEAVSSIYANSQNPELSDKNLKPNQSSIDAIKNNFDALLNNEFVKNPTVLTSLCPCNLTPAHLLVIDYLLYTRGMHFRGIEFFPGELRLYKELFTHAFNALKTDFASIAKITPGSTLSKNGAEPYLKAVGLTEKPMTANDLRKKLKLYLVNEKVKRN